MSHGTHCLNCEQKLLGEFCHQCGQRSQPLQLTLRHFMLGWLSETFEADGRLARTLGPMFLKPGYLAREYLAGKRAHYTSPLKLYIFTAVVGFLLLGLFYHGGFKINWNTEPGTHGDGLLAERLDVLSRLGPDEMVERIESGLYDTAPTVLTLLLPFVALLLKLLFWRRLYVEHMVFTLNQQAVFLILMVPALLTRWPPAVLAALLINAVHVLIAFRTTYGRSWPGTVLTWLLAVAGYGALLLVGIVLSFLAALATA